ncbi:hypothetical protein C8F01DRAFT_3311 [Mycena amicta]|nr:hypothetical protein C8F01DRAFT_3311 [Mycena amicta]
MMPRKQRARRLPESHDRPTMLSELQLPPNTTPGWPADRARLAQVEEEIARLEPALKELYAERDRLKERIESSSFPVSTLPTELIIEIFEQYVPPYPACPPLLGDASPTKLAQICRRWRAIAHSMSTLWRAIALFDHCAGNGPRVSVAQLETAAAWLERSGALPISVLMGYRYSTRYRRAEGLKLILAHRARWEYVSFDFPCMSGDAKRTVYGSMPSLRVLDVGHAGFEQEIDVIGLIDAPALRTAFLRLTSDAFQHLVTDHIPHVPWSQLTKLWLQSIEADVANTILRQTINLVHCRIEFFGAVPAPILTVVWLDSLESLILEGGVMSPTTIEGFVNSLRLPNLRQLCICENFLQDRFPTRHLSRVIDKFGCSLTRVCIIKAKTPPGVYRAAFPHVENVEFVAAYADGAPPSEHWGEWNIAGR